jgi:hypothetical protein
MIHCTGGILLLRDTFFCTEFFRFMPPLAQLVACLLTPSSSFPHTSTEVNLRLQTTLYQGRAVSYTAGTVFRVGDHIL